MLFYKRVKQSIKVADVEMSDDTAVKEESKEEPIATIKVSESLRKYIEQDNKAYEEEQKQVKEWVKEQEQER